MTKAQDLCIHCAVPGRGKGEDQEDNEIDNGGSEFAWRATTQWALGGERGAMRDVKKRHNKVNIYKESRGRMQGQQATTIDKTRGDGELYNNQYYFYYHSCNPMPFFLLLWNMWKSIPATLAGVTATGVAGVTPENTAPPRLLGRGEWQVSFPLRLNTSIFARSNTSNVIWAVT